jgi:hypothetical protein
MLRLALLALAVLGAACGDELPDGPGRPPSGPPPICQWKTPCQPDPAAALVVLPDGGAPDGGLN